VFVQNDGAGSARSDIDTKDGNTASFLRKTHARCPPVREFRPRFGDAVSQPYYTGAASSTARPSSHLRPIFFKVATDFGVQLDGEGFCLSLGEPLWRRTARRNHALSLY